MDATFFEWATLGTVVGATAAVAIVMSIFRFMFGSGINEKISSAIVVVVSVALLVAFRASEGGAEWEAYTLAVLNGFVVALAVLRLQDVTVPKLVQRVKGE